MEPGGSSNLTILSILPREIRDQIWGLCVIDGSQELDNGERRLSLCTNDCKEPGSCFPYDFFGPVCCDQSLQVMRQKVLRNMNLIFTCKQIMFEAGCYYRKVFTFTFGSVQCLEVFSAALGRERLFACVSQVNVIEKLKPCIPGNIGRLDVWRTGVKKSMEPVAAAYFNADFKPGAAWNFSSGQYTDGDRYWCKISLDR